MINLSEEDYQNILVLIKSDLLIAYLYFLKIIFHPKIQLLFIQNLIFILSYQNFIISIEYFHFLIINIDFIKNHPDI